MTKSAMRAAEELGLSAAEERGDGPRRTARRTVMRVDFAEAVYRCVGLSPDQLGILVQSVLDELADALIGQNPSNCLHLAGFSCAPNRSELGENPKTQIEVPITERRVMVFKPSNVLKARINGLAVVDEEDA